MELLRQIKKRILFPLILWRGGETERLRFLAEFEKSQYWDEERLRTYQGDKLSQLLAHAFKHSTFYRQRLEQSGYSQVSQDPFEVLSRMKPVEKSDIQKSVFEMVSDDRDPDSLIKNQTGGSTGEPIRFYLDQKRFEARVAGMHRHDGWAGFDIGHRAAYVWGAPQDKPSNSWKARLRNQLLGGQIWLDTSNVTDDKMRDFNEQLKRFRPRTIIAYANAVYMFARFIEDAGLSTYQPFSIITSAELLTSHARKTIERVFGCPVFNRYGCREFSIVGSECDQHDGLHINV